MVVRVKMAAHSEIDVPDLLQKFIHGTGKLEAQYSRLLADVMEVSDEMLDKIVDLGLGEPMPLNTLLDSLFLTMS